MVGPNLGRPGPGSTPTQESTYLPVLSASATKGSGIEALADVMEQHHSVLREQNLIEQRRHHYQGKWILKRLHDEFGSNGLARLGGTDSILEQLQAHSSTLFEHYEALRQRLL